MGTPFQLKNGNIMVSTEAPGGVYNAAQLKTIAEVCERESAIIKATEDQRLAVFIDPAKVGDVTKAFKSIGLGVRDYQQGLHQPVSCVGALCPDHEQDALGTSMELSEQLRSVQLSAPIKIGINGCARCCVPCHTMDIAVIGETGGYRISLGGKNSQLPEMAQYAAENVPAEALPELLVKVVTVYKNLAQESEALHEVINRCGMSEFLAALAPYSQDAGGGADFGGMESTPAAPAPSATDEEAPADLVEDPIADPIEDLTADLTEEPAIESPAVDDLEMEDTLGIEAAPTDETLGEDIAPEGELVLANDDIDIDPSSITESSTTEELGGDVLIDETADAESLVAVEEAAAEMIAVEEPALDATLLAEDPLAIENGADEQLSLAADDLETMAMPEPEMIGDSVDEQLSADVGADLVADLGDDFATETVAEEPQAAPPPQPIAAAVSHQEQSLLDGNPDDLMAEEVNDEAALKLEAELEESVATQAKLDERKDENSEDRMAAMKFMEEAASADPVDAEPLLVEDDLDFGVELAANAAEESAPAIGEDDVTLLDDPMTPAPSPAATHAPAAIRPIRPSQPTVSTPGFEFCGINTSADGHLVLEFASGAVMNLNLDRMGITEEGRTINVGGQSVMIRHTAEGWHVDVGGVDMYFPSISVSA